MIAHRAARMPCGFPVRARCESGYSGGSDFANSVGRSRSPLGCRWCGRGRFWAGSRWAARPRRWTSVSPRPRYSRRRCTISWSGASASRVCSSVAYWPVRVFFGFSQIFSTSNSTSPNCRGEFTLNSRPALWQMVVFQADPSPLKAAPRNRRARRNPPECPRVPCPPARGSTALQFRKRRVPVLFP